MPQPAAQLMTSVLAAPPTAPPNAPPRAHATNHQAGLRTQGHARRGRVFGDAVALAVDEQFVVDAGAERHNSPHSTVPTSPRQ